MNYGKKRVFSIESKLKMSKAKNPKQGDATYNSKNNRGTKSKSIIIEDLLTNQILHFTSILECSKKLNLNRTHLAKCYRENKTYKNYKIKSII